jgi:hypothetical protein
MLRQRAALSPGCRVYFRSSAPERGATETRATVHQPRKILPSRQREAGGGQGIQ